MSAKKDKQIRQTVRQLATTAITDLAYAQDKRTGTVRVAPNSKRGMVQTIKATMKHVPKGKK